MKEFNLIKFDSINQTLSFLAEKQGKCKVIAGGTDLTIALRNEEKEIEKIKYIVDISSLPEIIGIKLSERNLSIGAATTFTEIIRNKIVERNFSLLFGAASQIGSSQIRNMGTIGGNICNLAPSADSIAPLLVYNAKVKVISEKDEKIVSLKDFFQPDGAKQIDLKNDEILTEIILPIDENILNAKSIFSKLGRRKSVAISRMSFALLVKKNREKIIEDIRIGTGAVFRYPRRLFKIENKYLGKHISANFPAKISHDIAQEVLDKTGIRWSSAYKLPTLQQILFRLFEGLI